MPVYGGPRIENKNSLIFNFEAKGSRVSENKHRQSNILTPYTWTVGDTSATGFGRNGSADENLIIDGTGPFGEDAVLWQAYQTNDPASNADGGWVSSVYDIDNTKMYRLSVWVYREVLGNGSFYFGGYNYNSSNSNIGAIRRDNGSVNTNPYFWINNGTAIDDDWYLVVGHVWPVGSGAGDEYVDSGVYKISNGTSKVYNISYDFVFNTGGVRLRHRTYLYYSTDTGTTQNWAYPRMEPLDTAPTITDLLNNGPNKYRESAQNLTLTMHKNGYYDRAKGAIVLDGNDDYLTVNDDTNLKPDNITVIAVAKHNNSSGQDVSFIGGYGDTGDNGYWIGFTSSGFRFSAGNGNLIGGGSPQVGIGAKDNNINFLAGTFDGTTIKTYKNGQLITTQAQDVSGSLDYTGLTNFYLGNIQGLSSARYWDGDIYLYRVYNQALSESKILRIYNELKYRYGI